MKKIIRKTSALEAFSFLLVLTFCLYFTIRGTFYSSVIKGAEIFIACVFPSMLPYLFFTALLSENPFCFKFFSKFSPISQRLYGIDGHIFLSLFLSFISGYPMGAKVTADLKESGALTEAEAQRASIICSSSSPSFLIGSVGALMIKNFKFGALLFLTHFVSVIINGLIFSRFKRKTHAKQPAKITPFKKQSFYQVSLSSFLNVFAVGGIIIIFYLLTQILIDLKIVPFIARGVNHLIKNESISYALVLGTLETTCGFSWLCNLSPSLFVFMSGAFLSGFGGLSVIIQSTAFLKNAKIKTAPFILSKITCAVISVLLSVPIYLLLF